MCSCAGLTATEGSQVSYHNCRNGVDYTLYEAVPSRSQELSAFGCDAVPSPFKHLDNDILGARRGVQRMLQGRGCASDEAQQSDKQELEV